MIGAVLSRFGIIQKPGNEARSSVFQTGVVSPCRPISTKILPALPTSNQNGNTRFIRGARSAALLNYQNILSIFTINNQGGEDLPT